MRLTASELIGFYSFVHSEVMWPFSLQVKHLPSLINLSRLLEVSCRLGLAAEVMVRVVVLVLTFLAGVMVVAVPEVEVVACFSMYRSNSAFVRAASLSLWKTH